LSFYHLTYDITEVCYFVFSGFILASFIMSDPIELKGSDHGKHKCLISRPGALK